MTQGTSYNYNLRGDVVLTNRTGTTRSIPQNYKPLKATKGLTTVITFYLKEENGQPLQLHDKNITAKIVNHDGTTLHLSKNLTTTDYENGVAELKLTATNIANIDPGLQNLVLTFENTDGDTQALYVDQNYRTQYVLEILEDIIPAEVASDSFTDFTPTGSGDIALSSIVSGDAANKTDGTHTIAVYATDAVGTVTVQGTLVLNPTSRDWFDVTTVTYATATSGVNAYTFEGNYIWLRFQTDISSGSVDKILYNS